MQMKGTLGSVLLLVALAIVRAGAQSTTQQSAKKVQADTGTRIEIYGFAMADAIGDFRTNDPNWFDTNRPSKLPAFEGQFGDNGHTWFSGRQTQFGAKATIPTSTKDIKIVFDWDLFGVGVDAGQTTIRPRHMYGQWGAFGGGQLESPFMDINVFPNILEYWGPNGMLFYRNVQVFWEPINKENGTRALVALERPGASGDLGVLADRIEPGTGIAPRFPAPDLSAAYRLGTKWGYARISGILRWIRWDNFTPIDTILSGGVMGWGVALSGAINASPNDVLHLQIVEGAGVENYFNDAPVDVGPKRNGGNPVTITGQALNDLGLTAYLDHKWTKQLSTAIGYSRVNIDNSDLQTLDAFHSGQYASVNLLWSPLPSFLTGGEFQWAHRTNNGNGFAANDYRLQFSVKYSYSQKFGGGAGHEPTRAQD